MEASQLIRAWLNSSPQDYAQGVQLAKAHGVGGVQLTLLESGESSFTVGKLRKALQSILDQLLSQPTMAAAAAVVPPAAAAAMVATVASVAEPAELLAVRARRIATFKQAQHHFGQMRTAAAGKPRLEHAKAIKRLFRENAYLWNQEAYFLKFGFFPPEQPLATIDRTDLRAVEKRRNTLRTYITHAKAGKRAKSDPVKMIAAWTAEQMELDLILQHG